MLKLQDLAGELNGLGGAAGVEELRAPVAQAPWHCGTLNTVKTSSPGSKRKQKENERLKDHGRLFSFIHLHDPNGFLAEDVVLCTVYHLTI